MAEFTSLDRIIECAICLTQIQNPYILVKCLHSYCKNCIDSLPKKTQDGNQGWFCPMCDQFSDEASVKANFFVEDLLGVVNKNVKDCVKCDQCTNNVSAEWKCLDCQFNLCTRCQVSHLRIPSLKGHRVLPRDSQIDDFVDRLVYCVIHQDKAIKLNCKQCELPICILCQVTSHSGHVIETVDGALERLLPQLTDNTCKVTSNIKDIDSQIQGIDRWTQDTEEHLKQCKDEIALEYDKLMKNLAKAKEEKLNEVAKKHSVSVKPLMDIKKALENKERKCENLTNLVDTCTTKAKHTTLLREIQSGLFTNIQHQSEDQQDAIHVTLTSPTLRKAQEQTVTFEALIGEVHYEESNHQVGVTGQLEVKQEQQEDQQQQIEDVKQQIEDEKPFKIDKQNSLNFKDVLNQQWKNVSVSELSGFCNRQTVINKEIVACLVNEKVIKVAPTHKDETRTIKSKYQFFIIRQLCTGELISGAVDGLYHTSDRQISEDNKWTRLQPGSYCDICVHGNRFSALEYSKREIVTYELNEDTQQWSRHSVIPVKEAGEMSSSSTLVYHQEHFIVCASPNGGKIVKYRESGELVISVNRDKGQMLCGVDSSEQLLVAEWTSHQLCLYDTHTLLKVKDVGADCVPDLERPRDVIKHGQVMWLLSGYGKYFITKYTCTSLDPKQNYMSKYRMVYACQV